MASVCVLGGGISGLSAAYYLHKYGNVAVKKVYLLESSKRVGGWLQSKKLADGSIVEVGPRSIRFAGKSGQNIIKLVDELKLEPELIPVGKNHQFAAKRMILVNNQLHSLPTLSSAFKKTSPFTQPLILCALRDLIRKRKLCPDDNVYEFVERRFGEETAKYLADPICRGIFAGDSKNLSIKAFGKTFFEAEQEHRSVILGLLRKNKERSAVGVDEDGDNLVCPLLKRAINERWSLWSVRNGLQTMIDRLKEQLINVGVEIISDSPVNQLRFNSNNVQVVTKNNTLECDYVISSLPANCLRDVLIGDEFSPVIELLNSISFVNVGVVTLQFQQSTQSLLQNNQGFGFLVPSSEPVPILGVIFDSCIFPQHNSNQDKTTLTVMMGGHVFSKWFGDSPNEKQFYDTALECVNKYLNINSPVIDSQIFIHKNGIPQYSVGHFERVAELRSLIERSNLPLKLTGNSLDGVGVPDSVYSSKNQVKSAIRHMQNPYAFEVKENLQVGSLVGQIEAIDDDLLDTSNIYYYVIDADEEKTLAVDKLTGSIYTNRIQVVKIKIQVVLNIFVYVVDVNDNVPNFINSPYIAGISYDAPIGSIVINASAYDPDIEDQGNVIYTIEKTTLFSPVTRDSAKMLTKSPFGINNKGFGFMMKKN
ncbi:hypothetical protein CHUAL_009006 [Chamberlinius hualienensis]